MSFSLSLPSCQEDRPGFPRASDAFIISHSRGSSLKKTNERVESPLDYVVVHVARALMTRDVESEGGEKKREGAEDARRDALDGRASRVADAYVTYTYRRARRRRGCMYIHAAVIVISY